MSQKELIMKKPTKFKRQKAEAVNLLSNLPIKSFNRFTKEEILRAIGKDVLESKDDLHCLLTFCFEKTLTVKLNYPQFLLDIKLRRSSVPVWNNSDEDEAASDDFNEEVLPVTPKVKFNQVWCYVSPNMKKSSKFSTLSGYRGDLTMSISLFVELNNALCSIFEDYEGIQPTMLQCPQFNLMAREIRAIKKAKML